MMYPIHRNGVGACHNECPTTEAVAAVDGHDPADKSKMICMSESDFTEFTNAADHGITTFDALTPIDA